MRSLLILGVVLAAAAVSGCAAKAQVTPEIALPQLDPPPPPPRVVATAPEEEAPPPPQAEPVAAPPPAGPARRPARVDARPEPAATEAPKSGAAPSLTLTPAPGTEAQTEAAIRAMLSSAARDLSHVVPAALTPEERAQFDTARRFLQQAEEALKVRNLVYAGKLADKASTLAAVFAR